MAAAGAGPDVTELYQIATRGTSLDEEKHIQRRLKEAILKTSILYGVPKSLQALLPLFATLKEEQIDHYGPRSDLSLTKSNTYIDTNVFKEPRL